MTTGLHRKLGLSELALLGIILTYLVVATLFAIVTPSWQAPDEPAHYNYVRFVAERAAIPVLQPGDYNETYQRSAIEAHFASGYSIAPFRYEFHQPPLYYMLASAVYRVWQGALLPLRLFSAALGALLLVVVYAIGLTLFPRRSYLALGAAAFVAFLPMHTALLASVNNDSLAELIIALILLQCLRLIQSAPASTSEARRTWLLLGLTCGLGLITKSTVYAMLPVIGLTLVVSPLRAAVGARDHAAVQDSRLIHGFLVATPALVLALPWWLRNINLYGGFDFLGLQRHDAIVQGQLRTAQFVAENGWAALFSRFASWTFRSFWGQFGWMSVLMDERVYEILLIFSVLVVIGALLVLLRVVRHGSTIRHRQLVLLATTLAAAAAGYLWYNVSFVQHQARYLFPALSVIALAVVCGLDALVQLEPRRQIWLPALPAFGLIVVLSPGRWTLAVLALAALFLAALPLLRGRRAFVVALLVVSLVILDLISLYWYIVPQLGMA